MRSYTIVVNTSTLAGIPTRAGISKPSIDRITVKMTTEKVVGSARRSVTRQIVVHGPAPAAAAASSRLGSIERNVDASSRNTTGAQSSPSSRIMPPNENTLNGEADRCSHSRKATLISPDWGPSNRIQPTTLTMPGMANETNAVTYSSPLNGALVRSANQASAPPSVTPTIALPAPNSSVLSRTVGVAPSRASSDW